MRCFCPQVHLIRRLCDRFGVALADEVLQETLAKEVCSLRRERFRAPVDASAAQSAGGMLTADGSRRREAGGTYLKLFAACVPCTRGSSPG